MASSGLRILATSRHLLGIEGESAFTVPPLSLPAPEQPITADSFGRYEGVRLFAERCASSLPGFTISERNLEPVIAICRRLDGIPLAIELAAVRMRSLAPEQILERLDDRYRLLTAGRRAVWPHQRTLRSTIEWSYDLCSVAERALWARLSVFAGSFDLRAAEEVCSGRGIEREEVFDLISQLVDKSILARENNDVSARYRLLETIRQYGHELLASSGDEPTFRRRHRDYFRQLAQKAEKEWFGPHQIKWINWVRAESSNLRSALEYSFNHPGNPPANGADEGFAMTAALAVFWIATGSLQEGRHWLHRAIDSSPDSTLARIKIQSICGFVNMHLGDIDAAVSLIDESRALARSANATSTDAYVTQYAGMAALRHGDVKTAAVLLDDALAKHRARNHDLGGIAMTEGIPEPLLFLGELPRAKRLAEEALALTESHDAGWSRSWVSWVYGLVMWQSGDHHQAVHMLRDAIRLKRMSYDLLGMAFCVESIAWVAADAGWVEMAAELLGISQAFWKRLGSTFVQSGHFKGLHDEARSAAMRALGADAFELTFERGTRLPFTQAMTRVLDLKRVGEKKHAGEAEESFPDLTRREQEVADLVAQGMSNKEIASTLVISQRTAEGHVENILTKLGFTSRTQIAVWTSRNER